VGTADDAATAEADCFLRTKEYRKYWFFGWSINFSSISSMHDSVVGNKTSLIYNIWKIIRLHIWFLEVTIKL
jgi:hypothetical protein